MAKKHSKNVAAAIKALTAAQKQGAVIARRDPQSRNFVAAELDAEKDAANREKYRELFLKYKAIVDAFTDKEAAEFEPALREHSRARMKKMARGRKPPATVADVVAKV